MENNENLKQNENELTEALRENKALREQLELKKKELTQQEKTFQETLSLLSENEDPEQVAELKNEMQKLKLELANQTDKRQLNDTIEKLNSLEAEVIALSEAKQKLLNDYEQKEIDLTKLKKNYVDVREQKANSDRLVQQLTDEKISLLEKSQMNENELAELKTKNANLKKQLLVQTTTLTQSKNQLTTEHEKLKMTYQESLNETNDLKNQLSDLMKTKMSIESELTILKDQVRVERVEHEKAIVLKEESHRKQLLNKEKEIKEVQRVNDLKEKELTISFEKNIEDIKEAHQKKLNEKHRIIESVETQNSELLSKISYLENQIKGLNHNKLEADEARQKLAEARESFAKSLQLMQTIPAVDYKPDIEETAEYKELLAKYKVLEEALNEINDSKLHAKEITSKAEINVEEKVKSLESQLTFAIDSLSLKSKEVSTVNEQLNILKDEIHGKDSQIRRLKQKLEEVNFSHQEMVVDPNFVEKQEELFYEEIQKKDDVIESLMDELNSLKAEKETNKVIKLEEGIKQLEKKEGLLDRLKKSKGKIAGLIVALGLIGFGSNFAYEQYQAKEFDQMLEQSYFHEAAQHDPQKVDEIEKYILINNTKELEEFVDENQTTFGNMDLFFIKKEYELVTKFYEDKPNLKYDEDRLSMVGYSYLKQGNINNANKINKGINDTVLTNKIVDYEKYSSDIDYLKEQLKNEKMKEKDKEHVQDLLDSAQEQLESI